MISAHQPTPWPKRGALVLVALASAALAPANLGAVTLSELIDNPQLNAKKFANYFGNFAYEFNSGILPPDEFLARERGDCDDYAVLADFILSKRGLGTRLVHVRLTGRVAHAVCYVTENNAYLDYNNRKFFVTLERSGPDLRTIANKVADSLSVSWTTASEFTYSYETRRKTMTATVSRTGGGQPVPGQPSPFHVE